MNPLTEAEKAALRKVAAQLNSMATIAATIATIAPSSSDDEVTLSMLRPSGGLDDVAEQIRANTPITDEDLATLMEAAQNDIQFNSRLNGVLVNVTAVAGALRSVLLPLLAV